jgi:hypothetical protein
MFPLHEVKKYVQCLEWFRKMREMYSPTELEEILYESDRYGCTVLHYACRYKMRKLAIYIIENTFNESNMYKISHTGLTPLIICCRNRNLHSVFKKILEKTQDEVHLYLGQSNCLSFCILNEDEEKVKMILEKTHNIENLYRGSLYRNPLLFSLEKRLLNISAMIVEKTDKKRYLQIQPDSPLKNAFDYLKDPFYCSIVKVLNKKYQRFNCLLNPHSTLTKHFQEKKQLPLDIIRLVASFLQYELIYE